MFSVRTDQKIVHQSNQDPNATASLFNVVATIAKESSKGLGGQVQWGYKYLVNHNVHCK